MEYRQILDWVNKEVWSALLDVGQSQIEKLLSEQKEKILYNECGCEFDGQLPVRLQADGKQENKNFELQKRKTAGTFRTADRVCGIGRISVSYAGT